MGYLRLAVAIVLILSLAACGKSGSSESGGKAETAKPAPSAVGGSQEQPATKDDATQNVELKGNDLLAWKLAYEAASYEAEKQRKRMVAGGITLPTKICVVPDLPRTNLMSRTAIGDYEFTFGMELHQYWPEADKRPAGVPSDSCVLGILKIPVVDFSGTMRAAQAKGGFGHTGTYASFVDEYANLFGETDGVKANRAEVTSKPTPSPVPLSSSKAGTIAPADDVSAQSPPAKWEGKVVQGDVRNNVYFIHKGIRYYVTKWDYVTPFGLWGDSRMLKVNQAEIDALPEGHVIDSVDEMRRCLAR